MYPSPHDRKRKNRFVSVQRDSQPRCIGFGLAPNAPIGDAFTELLKQWNIQPRLEAVGEHRSIAVTERVIQTFKYEWLPCLPVVEGFDHLTLPCKEFASRSNTDSD